MKTLSLDILTLLPLLKDMEKSTFADTANMWILPGEHNPVSFSKISTNLQWQKQHSQFLLRVT
jgi:hypothetical protein